MLTAKMKQLEKAGKALVDSGAVTDAYIQAMKDREQVVYNYGKWLSKSSWHR